jgi:hypothetical protein
MKGRDARRLRRVSKADDSDTAAQVKALRQAGYTSRALSQCDPIAKGVYLPCWNM